MRASLVATHRFKTARMRASLHRMLAVMLVVVGMRVCQGELITTDTTSVSLINGGAGGRLSRSLLQSAATMEYYSDYESPATTLPEWLEARVTAGDLPATNTPQFNSSFTAYLRGLLGDARCKAELQDLDTCSVAAKVALVVMMDMTWETATAQQAMAAFVLSNAQYTFNYTQSLYFDSLADLKAEPSPLDQLQFWAAFQDCQQAYYSGGLTTSLWADPLYQADNAEALAVQNPVGLIYPRTYFLMLYRSDVFAERQLSPPATWDDLLATAEALAGSNFTGAGAEGGYAVCFTFKERCKANFLLMTIAASFIQYQGVSQGLYLDPPTMEPLVDNPAMREALRIVSRLRALGVPGSDGTCEAWNADFAQGRCAMTLEWDINLRNMVRDKQLVKGKLGVALAPGSAFVLDRGTNTLVPCTATLCPYATPELTISTKPAPSNASSNARRAATSTPTTLLVNRAPFSTFGDVLGYLNPNGQAADPAISGSLLNFINSFLNPQKQYIKVKQTLFNEQVLALEAANQVPRYDDPPDFNYTLPLQHNFDLHDLQAMYPAVWAARYHPNPACDIATATGPFFRIALEEGLLNVSRGQDPALVLPRIANKYRLIIALNIVNGTTEDFRAGYWRTIAYAPPPPPPGQGGGGSSSGSDTAVIVAVTVSAGVLLLAALAGLAAFQIKMRRRTLLGSVMPPGVHADTTLVCTDIENSRVLWEALESRDMDTAVGLHHECLRKCMRKRSGYLSTVEGDSFVIAFHDARHAVLFAVNVQSELLKVKWPAAILNSMDGRPVWVHRRSDRLSHSQHNLDPASGGGGSHTGGRLTRNTSQRTTQSGISRLQSGVQMFLQANRTENSSEAKADMHMWSTSLGLRPTPSYSGVTAHPVLREESEHRGDDNNHSASVLGQRDESLDVSRTLAQTSHSARLNAGGSGGGALAVVPPSGMSGPSRPPSQSKQSQSGRSTATALNTATGGGGAGASVQMELQSTASVSEHRVDLEEDVADSTMFGGHVLPAERHTLLRRAWGGGGDRASEAGRSLAGASQPVWELTCTAAAMKGPMTWQELMREGWDVEYGKPNSSTTGRSDRILILCGLRVRMGLFSGIASNDDIVLNRQAGNVQYSGESLEAAKTLCAAAGGGMVLLSGETYMRLRPEQVLKHAVIVYAGDYHLDKSPRQWVVYQAAPVALPQRMAMADPVRCEAVLQLGTPSAPVGMITVAFLYIIGAATLLINMPDEGRQALDLCHSVVTAELMRWGGYLVEGVDGLVLAMFSNASNAAQWGLACHEKMLKQEWSPAILAYEACEEVFVMESPQRRRVLLRGLRLKIGLDIGDPTPGLNSSGRMSYRGRVLNRASRIASKGTAGHVLSSAAAWAAIQKVPSHVTGDDAEPRGLTAQSMGTFNLKGLLNAQELFDVRFAAEDVDHEWPRLTPKGGINEGTVAEEEPTASARATPLLASSIAAGEAGSPRVTPVRRTSE